MLNGNFQLFFVNYFLRMKFSLLVTQILAENVNFYKKIISKTGLSILEHFAAQFDMRGVKNIFRLSVLSGEKCGSLQLEFRFCSFWCTIKVNTYSSWWLSIVVMTPGLGPDPNFRLIKLSRPKLSLIRLSRRKLNLNRLSRPKVPLIRLSRHKGCLIRLFRPKAFWSDHIQTMVQT